MQDGQSANTSGIIYKSKPDINNLRKTKAVHNFDVRDKFIKFMN